MDKVIHKVKSVRHNWWKDLKGFMRLKGYHYYEAPKELKFRYPAPGSVPRNETDRPNLYKNDYKTAFYESEYDIRNKPLTEVDRPFNNLNIYHGGIKKQELDPENPSHAEVLKGPVRNRRLIEDEATYYEDEDFHPNNRDNFRAQLRESFEQAPEDNLFIADNWKRLNANLLDQVYHPRYLWFYERGAMGTGDDPNVQHTYLSIEYLFEEVLGKERIETKEMDMYKGTVKKWQVLDDEQFTQDQIDKVQNAIKAPISDELDRYADQNNVKMQLPINNANVSEWRDKRRAIDSADFNSKLIEFEQNRHQNYFMKRFERPKRLE